ncbi:MAG: 30S ribosomal protein S17 [Candidatus Lernaella stagnicola]|nr:30S ribosomal protein S17 [Candidatus Lernaella stagnicola]
MASEEKRGNRRVLQGVVISDKAAKTVTVKVDRFFQHTKYKKYIRRSKKYMAHDEHDTANTGDTVQIVESRPFSAQKRWRVTKIVKRAD